MTVSSTTTQISYHGDGSTVAFSVPFPFIEDSHIIATLVLVSDGSSAVTSAYTLTGAGNPSGGTLTMDTAPSALYDLYIRREVPITQETDYITDDPFPAQSHEDALDKLTMIAQQNGYTADRSIRLRDEDTSPGTDLFLPLAADRALMSLAFTVGGAVTVAAPVAVTVASGSAIQSANSVIAAKALTGLVNNQFVKLTGYYAANDGGGGDLIYSSGSAATADNGMVFALDSMPGRLLRLLNGQPRNVRMFGAKGDGVTDDLPAFNAAVSSFGPNLGIADDPSYVGGELIIPKHNGALGYFLNGTWKPRKRIHIHGEHAGQQFTNAATRLIFPANTDGIGLESFQISGMSDPQFTKISDLNIYCNSKLATGRGVYSSCVFFMENVRISNFAGRGVEIIASAGAGNADGFSLKYVAVSTCGGDGFFVSGSDAQIGTFYQCDASGNAGWGFNDIASYGNSYYECHSSGNTLGSYRAITSVTYFGNYYFKCYVEFGATETPSFDENVVVIGGTLQNVAGSASGIGFRSPGGFGPNVPTGGIHMWFVNLAEKMRLTAANILQGMAGVNVNGGTAGTSTNINEYQTVSTGITTAGQNHHVFVNPNGTVGTITVSGSATAYNTSSDHRLKEDVQPLADALELVAQIKPVNFRWKADGSEAQGFIAHELQEVVPQAVTGVKDAEEYQLVDASKVVPLLTAAIQELLARIKVLENKE